MSFIGMFACSVFFFIVVCLFCILYFICIFLLLLPTWRIKLMMMNMHYLPKATQYQQAP